MIDLVLEDARVPAARGPDHRLAALVERAVPTRWALPVEVTISATFRKEAFGVPQILSTISGVYRARAS